MDPPAWYDHGVTGDEIHLCMAVVGKVKVLHWPSGTHSVDGVDRVAEPLLLLLATVTAPLLVLVKVLGGWPDEEEGLAATKDMIVDARGGKVDVLRMGKSGSLAIE
jgi:hypothetical protein